MTDEVADWSGDWVVSEIAARRLRLQIHSTVNDSTGSTIMIIIVGPMIGSSSVPLLMLLLIVAMIAVMIVGSINDMCNRFGVPTGCRRDGRRSI